MAKQYIAVRGIQSGGVVGIAMSRDGNPTYATEGPPCAFVRRIDAVAWANAAQARLPQLAGQMLGVSVSEQDQEE